MSNQLSEHSRQLRIRTAAAHNKAKLASGEYRSITLTGRAEDVAVIDAAIALAGGSRVQALKKICGQWMQSQK